MKIPKSSLNRSDDDGSLPEGKNSSFYYYHMENVSMHCKSYTIKAMNARTSVNAVNYNESI